MEILGEKLFCSQQEREKKSPPITSAPYGRRQTPGIPHNQDKNQETGAKESHPLKNLSEGKAGHP
jgi:hypothetical protein